MQRFDAFRRFLRTARDEFSRQSNIGERLAGCGPVIGKILTHLGLEPHPPPRSKAREAGLDFAG
jgi:hypothetical protein